MQIYTYICLYPKSIYVQFIPMYYPCIIHVLSMYYPCIIHVLSMYYPCIIHVLSMYYPCISTRRHPVSPNITFRFQGFRVQNKFRIRILGFIYSVCRLSGFLLILEVFLRFRAYGLGFEALKFYGVRVQDDLCKDAQVPYLFRNARMIHFLQCFESASGNFRGVWPYLYFYPPPFFSIYGDQKHPSSSTGWPGHWCLRRYSIQPPIVHQLVKSLHG